MNENETPVAEQAQSFEQRTVVIAALACFASLILLLLVGKSLMQGAKIAWAELAACALIPILVTFTIFYCSAWKQELKGLARVVLSLLRSLYILIVEVFIAGMLLGAVWFISMAVSGGNH